MRTRGRLTVRACGLLAAVTLAASISLHLLTAEHQMWLTTHTGAVLASGRDISDDLLAALAVVEPDRTGQLTAGAVAGTGMLIAILGMMICCAAALGEEPKKDAAEAVLLGAPSVTSRAIVVMRA